MKPEQQRSEQDGFLNFPAGDDLQRFQQRLQEYSTV